MPSGSSRRTATALDELRLRLAALERAPRHELDPRLHDEHAAQPVADLVGERVVGAPRRGRARRSPAAAGPASRPAPLGRTRMLPLTLGSNACTTSRTADGKTLTPRTISMSSVRPMQRMRGPVRPQRQSPSQTSTWSRVRKRSSGAARWRRCVSTSSPVAPSAHSSAAPGRRVDQLGMDEAARAEVHAVLLLALAPERDADVADAHRLGHLRAPPRLELRAERRLAAARLARDEHALDRRAREVEAALVRPLDQVRRVRRREHRRLGAEPLDRAARAARVLPVPTGTWHRPMRSNAASAAPATHGPAL